MCLIFKIRTMNTKCTNSSTRSLLEPINLSMVFNLISGAMLYPWSVISFFIYF